MTLPAASLGPSAYWYLARGTGTVALLLLSASVVLGILGPLRFHVGRRWPRFAVDTLHRDISLLVLALIVVHVLTSVLDGFAPISLTSAIIPVGSSYRPLWLGLGALSFDLLLALAATSLLRRRIGYGAWRAVHWLAYVSWPVAVLHGLGTGSDTKVWWMLLLTAVCVGAVAAAVAVRIGRARPANEGLRAPLLALTFITPVALAIFTLVGPLQHGWARRAGTPARLLTGTRFASATAPSSASATASATATGTPVPSTRFVANLNGTATQRSAAGGAIIDLALRLTGGASGRLRIRLAGAPMPGGGLSLTGSQVDLLDDGLSSVMQGRIVSLTGQRFSARLTGAGSALELHGNLNIDSDTGQVTGSVQASPTGGAR